MKVIHKHKVYLDSDRNNIRIDVMQGDSNTRVLDFSLYSGAVAWNVPDGVSVAVAYVRRDGAKGIYDTLADDSAAISVVGNVVSATLVPQALAVAGDTKLTVVFMADGEQLATFCVTLRVAANPAIGAVEPEDYINLRQVLIEMVEKAMEETGALPDFVVGVFGGEAGYFSDESFLDIQYAYNSGRTIRCTFDTGEQELVKLPLVKDHPGKFYFSAVCEGVEYLVTISEDEAGETAVTVTQRTVGEGSEGSGKDGGYYLPTVKQAAPGTMTMSFSPSKSDMPAVPPVALVLPQGEKGDTGATGAAGKDGADGYTPVKGVDYWTDADKAEMVQDVIDALGGSPVFGTVDADNNIILTGELVDGTYTLKYEDAEGNQTEIGTIVVGAETMPDSGTVELTWATGVKLDKTTGAEGAGDGYSASQSIEITDGYTYTVTGTANYHGMTICFYDADGAYLGYTELWSASAHSEPISSAITMLENTASIRLRAYHSNSDIAACTTLSFAKAV